MNEATRRLYMTLGAIAGIMGMEHGIGEALQGPRPTGGVFILSWPEAPFFKVMAGEPAMTMAPNYLATGILAIVFSGLFLLVLMRPNLNGRQVAALWGLLAMMLLFGAGFGPPVLGSIALLIALKRNSRLKLWSRLPVRVNQVLSSLWPWAMGLCLAGWLMLFPGAGLMATLTGWDSEWLMMGPILAAFGMIPVAYMTGLSRDVLGREEEAGG